MVRKSPFSSENPPFLAQSRVFYLKTSYFGAFKPLFLPENIFRRIKTAVLIRENSLSVIQKTPLLLRAFHFWLSKPRKKQIVSHETFFVTQFSCFYFVFCENALLFSFYLLCDTNFLFFREFCLGSAFLSQDLPLFSLLWSGELFFCFSFAIVIFSFFVPL